MVGEHNEYPRKSKCIDGYCHNVLGLSYTFMVMGLETLAVYNVVALRCIIAFFVAGLIFTNG